MSGHEPSPPGLEELLRRNLEGELHRLQLERGRVIAGKWTLNHRLGAGGFGQVWEAWHVELQRKHAIKFLDGQHRDPAAVRARFLAEAQLLARLESEHLVRVVDYGELPEEVPYFVMELVQGPTLRQRMSEPLSVPRAVEIAEQLLEALHDVHARGLTHGDIKPENIILSGPEEKVRVLDFGLAQITVLATGVAGGTPPYMAPELVLDGKPSSPCSDVYAVGVVLYEMLTGELPYGHASMGLEEIQQSWAKKPDVTPIRVLRKDVPAALDGLVMKALSRDPSTRLATAGAMMEALHVLAGPVAAGLADTVEPAERPATKGATKEAAETEPMTPEPAARDRRRGLKVAVLVGAVGASVGLAWHWWAQGEEPAVAVATLPEASPREPAEPQGSGRLPAGAFASAKDGVVLAVVEGSPEHVNAAYGALCSALRGAGKRLSCARLPAGTSHAAAIAAAQADGVRKVLLVGEEIVVRSTSHDQRSPLAGLLEGLPLPRESAMGDAAIVLRAVVDPVGSKDEAIPVLALKEWDARWVVLAEWLRERRGQGDPEAAARLADAMQALGDRAGFAHDLAVILRARHASCEVAAGPITELTQPGLHEPGIRIRALLDLAACAVEGTDVRLDRAERAEALVDQALEISGGDPCVQVAALGTISRIDLWRGNDALWREHGLVVTRDACDEPTVWSQVISVRGDALATAGRWCEATSAHEQAHHEMPTRVEPLLAWAETSWRCAPKREAEREELLAALERGIASRRFGAAARVSLAYVRWWLTREPADAQRVMEQHATIELGKPALLEGVGSDVEREICKGVEERECSLTILRSPRHAGDEERLRAALGLRR